MYKFLYILANAALILVMLALGLISHDPEAHVNIFALALVLSIISFFMGYIVFFALWFMWELLGIILGDSILFGCVIIATIVAFFGLPYIFLSVGIWTVNLFANIDLTISNWLLAAILAWIPTLLTIKKPR